MFVFEEPSWLSLLHSSHGLFGGDGDDSGDDAGDDEFAEDDESDDEDDDGDEADDSGTSDSSDDGDDEDDDDQGGQSRKGKVDIKALKRENRKLRRDLEDALDMLEEAEARNGSGDEDEDSEQVSELRARIETLEGLLNGQYVKNAISTFKNKDGSPRWDWIDVEDVFNLLDADDLEIDEETGEIDGLEEQLEDIAKRKPHFLRKKQKKESDGGGTTGSRPGGSGRGKDKPMSGEDYVKKYGAAYSILTR